MLFTTPVNIQHSRHEISYDDRILMIGSCFTENISGKLQESYFRVATNPFGILYNPASIARCIEVILDNTPVSELPIVSHNGLWHSMLHHGDFSRADRQEAEAAFRRSIEEGREALSEASVVIVTFGTAWVYETEGEIAGNCHKLPQDRFVRRRLTAEEIVSEWSGLLRHPLLKDKHFIFTVSPIRHIKDGLHENQLSKATLLLAIDQLTGSQVHKFTTYFPSYEILIDELRDYRFFAEDMVHPSSVAVDYIWERFSDTYFSAQTKQEMQPLRKLYCDLHHRPLHPDTEEYKRFREQTIEKARALSKKYPWISEELV